MRTILVEDEEGARGYLKELLRAHEEVTVVGEADHPVEAIRQINQLVPDLVFLDIQLPLLNGFQMLPYLKTRPIIIFCTAHDEYAVKAFEANALDYLLKPVRPDRLALALGRASNEWQKLSSLKNIALSEPGLRSIVCHRGDAHHALWLRDILLFQKDGRYTAVHSKKDGLFLTDLTLDYLEEKITHDDFFRINRSEIIRKDQIRSYRSGPHGSGQLQSQSDTTHSVSRGRFQAFKSWFSLG